MNQTGHSSLRRARLYCFKSNKIWRNYIKKLYFSTGLLLALLGVRGLGAQEGNDLSKSYPILSVFYNVPDNDKKYFQAVNFRYGWTSQPPYQIAVQFSNPEYSDLKIKFAVKDVTSNQLILLDPTHQAFFGLETLKPLANGQIWSGPVDSLKDQFSLRAWNSDDDEMSQEPISILSSWTQKSADKPEKIPATPTPTVAPANTPQLIPSTLTKTPTPTCTWTATVTPTATITPTKSQTPAPNYKSVFIAIGSSFTAGDNCDVGVSFKDAANRALSAWYPEIVYKIFAPSGALPSSYASYMPTELAELKQLGIPVRYMVFEIGTLCFYEVNGGAADDERCKGASLSQGVTYSYHYQKQMDQIIGDIYAFNPDIHLVVLTIPDKYAGKGTYAPTGVYEAYRQRLYELKVKYPKMRIADAYTGLMDGKVDYFNGQEHPNTQAHAVIGKLVLEQFANWPYQPAQHQK